MGTNIASSQESAVADCGASSKRGSQKARRGQGTGTRSNASLQTRIASKQQFEREQRRGSEKPSRSAQRNPHYHHLQHQHHRAVDMSPSTPPKTADHALPQSHPHSRPTSHSLASRSLYHPRSQQGSSFVGSAHTSRTFTNPRSTAMNYSRPRGSTGIHVRSPPRSRPSNMIDYSKISNIAPPWNSWESLGITITGVPEKATTFTLWKAFKGCGSVDFIEIFLDRRGAQAGKARLRFKPPPVERFWLDKTHPVELDDGRTVMVTVYVDTKKSSNEVPSPVDPNITYSQSLAVSARFLEIGAPVGERSMFTLRKIEADYPEELRFVTDLLRREVNVFFQLTRSPVMRAPPITNYYRIRIPFVQLSHISRITNGDDTSFVISLDSPPLYYRLQDPKSTFSDAESVWRAADAWYRQTDIVHNPQDLLHAPISLRKLKALINIGRWTTIRLTFKTADIKKNGRLETLCNIFRDFNITLEDVEDFKAEKLALSAPIAWRWIDPPSSDMSRRTSSVEDLAENEYTHLPFVVRYQLEVCISNGYLSEYKIEKEFTTRLAALGERTAKDLLEHVASKKIPYHDPLEIFNIQFFNGATNRKIPKYCCYMRSARVTPSTIYFNTPSVDISNRVIRHYIEYADRFLRVRFTDERLEGRINSTYNNCMDEVFKRVKRAMTNGITLGDRHYEFLAFGNSQFREHGAYFFASLPNLTASNIRAWMGNFSNIKVVAKHAARLGQCFSTTRAVTGCPVQLREIDDIERNGHNFSDGVGLISRFLAQMVMAEFKIRTPSNEPPSVFQFRLGGCKGILTVWPEAQRQEVHIRKSQYKFAAIHNGLEIIRHSQFSMASLNRQLIVVLSCLGIPDDVFIHKIRLMLENLEVAMTSETRAMHLLQKYVDPNQMTLLLADMVHNGFQSANEPFVTSLLELWRAWTIKYLKEKAKIVIEKGACLFGCVDETSTLKGYFEKNRPAADATYEQKVECLPEIFVQISHPEDKGKYEIIEGPCIVARNPSLHPGDIRVVRAVDVPALHHIKDAVVFPQTGDRDIPGMCSGGDLDGDDYIVVWDKDLLPTDWSQLPMKHPESGAEPLDRDVTVNDITSFFVTYMQNDRLPQIAHAHLAFADYLEDGVYSDKCTRLASLHSAAVDYNKSGIPARMTKDLLPRKWPHFMEKKHKPKEAQYKSRKILGQLYDIVERVDFRPKLEAPFDERILNSKIEVSEEIMATALEMKTLYDADMHRIMAQHEIKTEFEVWSTFVLGHANMSKDYKFHEELGQISSALREKYLDVCHEKVGGKDFRSLAPLAVAMYRVTCKQMTDALAKIKGSEGETGEEGKPKVPVPESTLPLISFPWVLQPTLGDIANRHFDTSRIAGEEKAPDHITPSHENKKKRQDDGADIVPRDVETVGGVQPAGELLKLFQADPDFDPFSGLGDAFDKKPGTPDNEPDKEKNKEPETKQADTSSHMNSLIDFDDDGIVFSDEPVVETTSGIASPSPLDEDSVLMDISDHTNGHKEPLAKTQDQQESAKLQDLSTLDETENQAPNVDTATTGKEAAGVEEDVDDESDTEIILGGTVKPSPLDELEQILGL